MNNIWNEAQEKVYNGAKFHVDLVKRHLRIDGKYIIKDGQYEGDLGCDTNGSLDEWLAIIEDLYWQYLHSVPSARSDAKHRRYFQALPGHKLTEDDMLYGSCRELAQLRLELYLLITILNGSLSWDELSPDKWFWQSSTHPTFIILKQWIQ